MKAIIMAGGEGTRLRPLTCDCPKPMMRLMDRPVMEYALCLLREHGVKKAAVTLGYLPERIPDYFGGGEEFGINLTYYTERVPLGTAGGVRQAKDMLDETFIVLSGDGVTDCDLTKMYEFHKSKGAKATVVLKRVSNPMAYGLVITDENGRITRFLEKPGWGEVVTDAVNTGIYILEPEVLNMIPEGPFDFGRELLPRMAEEGGLYGCVTDGYWCDIGDIGAYMGVCRDALDGKICLPLLGGAQIAASAYVDESAIIEQPCFIGENAVIEKGAAVGAYSVIGRGARVGKYAGTKRAVLWPGARLMEGAQARGCVLAKSAVLGAMARAYENSVLGTGARGGADCEIAPGVAVWPGKTVAEATLQSANLVWGAARAACFSGGMLPVNAPSEALLAAQAFAAQLKPREVLLARAPSAVSCAMWHGCASGLMAQGVRVLDAGVCSEPQLRFAVSLMRADGAILAGSDGILPINGDGCRVSLGDQRGICSLMARQDYPQPFTGITHPVTASARSERAYCAHLAAAFSADRELAPGIAVHSQDQCLLNLAEQAFMRAGLRGRVEWEDEMMELSPGEIGVWLEEGGASARFACTGGELDATENEMLLYWTALEMGETELIISPRATGGISALAERYSATVTSTGGGRPAFERALKRFPEQFRLHTDGLYLAMAVVSALTVNAMTLGVWRETCPRMRRVERKVRLADDLRGRVLRALAEKERVSPEDGITLERENVRAWITPDDALPECRIVAEAFQTEIAEEFCDFCEKELNGLIET